MSKIYYEVFDKVGKNTWESQVKVENQLEVYKRLCDELISKKINGSNFIRKITRRNLYTGYQEISVFYARLEGCTCDTKVVYHVKNTW